MKVQVGNLPTLNQDEYPGLGDWFVQLWNADNLDLVVARVYGNTPFEAMEKAHSMADKINGLRE